MWQDDSLDSCGRTRFGWFPVRKPDGKRVTGRVFTLLSSLILLAGCDDGRSPEQLDVGMSSEDGRQWVERSQQDFARWIETPLEDIEGPSGGCRAWTDTVSCEFYFRSAAAVRLKRQESYRDVRCESISGILEQHTEWMPRIERLTCQQSGSLDGDGPASGLVRDPTSDSYFFWASYSSSEPPENSDP